MSIAASKPVIVTAPSIATGTPFSNLTEYSKISPAEVDATEPDDKSIFGEPASAASFNVVTLTREESETPVNVIVPVESLSLPKLIVVSPSIVETISTFEEPPELKLAGAPVPLRAIVSVAGSKPDIKTLPSDAVVTEPSFAKLTSYKNVSALEVAAILPALASMPAVALPLPEPDPPEPDPPPSVVGVVGVGLTAPPPPPPPPPHAARSNGRVIADR